MRTEDFVDKLRPSLPSEDIFASGVEPAFDILSGRDLSENERIIMCLCANCYDYSDRSPWSDTRFGLKGISHMLHEIRPQTHILAYRVGCFYPVLGILQELQPDSYFDLDHEKYDNFVQLIKNLQDVTPEGIAERGKSVVMLATGERINYSAIGKETRTISHSGSGAKEALV
jgi:hypothetical protein